MCKGCDTSCSFLHFCILCYEPGCLLELAIIWNKLMKHRNNHFQFLRIIKQWLKLWLPCHILSQKIHPYTVKCMVSVEGIRCKYKLLKLYICIKIRKYFVVASLVRRDIRHGCFKKLFPQINGNTNLSIHGISFHKLHNKTSDVSLQLISAL